MTTDFQLHIARTAHVTTLTFERPPHNFVNEALLRELADAVAASDADAGCRAIVLASAGKNFCAGADFSGVGEGTSVVDPEVLYRQAMRLFDGRKPMVAAVQGTATGAGAGLALVADFRIASEESRFSVNFNRLGFHPGFGLSHTLPRLIGVQKAALLFYSGRRVAGAEALSMGLVDEIAPPQLLLERAQALAAEIATAAPLAVQSTRTTLRLGFVDEVRRLNGIEMAAQKVHFAMDDFKEGVLAAAQRRIPVFHGC
jgi:enoyl-CoA hydratase/carnithine racemase